MHIVNQVFHLTLNMISVVPIDLLDQWYPFFGVILCKSLCVVISNQDCFFFSENYFFPKRPEKGGKRLFIPVLSKQNEKKLEKNRKNWKMSEMQKK